MLDDMVVSTSAKATGRNVTFSYGLKVKRGLPQPKLAEFKQITMDEIVPKACQMNAKNEAFRHGLFCTFVYHNAHGEKLMRGEPIH